MSMKQFIQYLTESTKTYSFRIKVAGEVPEKFEETLHAGMSKWGCEGIKKVATTPIQKSVKDFPELENVEVTVYENTCTYPCTPQEISLLIKEMCCIDYSHFRVRNANDPSEEEMPSATDEPSGEAVLNDNQYKEAGKIKHKDYFGDDFNRGFLKDLQKASKERAKEAEYKLAKQKEDKSGIKSAMGS